MVEEPQHSDDTREEAMRVQRAELRNAWTALSFLLAGVLFYGGLGWGLDWLLGTPVFTPVGIVLGGAAGVYLIWVRYVKS